MESSPPERIATAFMMRDYREMRAFLAISFPSELSSRVEDLQQALKRADADVRWVPSQNLHLTLKFLGEIEDACATELSGLLRPEIERYSPLELHFEGVGRFPKGGPPRVLWVGCRGDVSPLIGLAQLCERAASVIDVPEERRSFSPHLTIGRVKSGRNRESLLRAMEARFDEVIGPLRVPRITLYKSELTPQGAIYQVLEEFSLGVRT